MFHVGIHLLAKQFVDLLFVSLPLCRRLGPTRLTPVRPTAGEDGVKSGPEAEYIKNRRRFVGKDGMVEGAAGKAAPIEAQLLANGPTKVTQ